MPCLVVLLHIPTCSVSAVAWRYALLVKSAMLVVWLHIPHLLCEWCRLKICKFSENAIMLVVLLHIPTCSVSGVAGRFANLVKNAMLVVLLHISTKLCEWCR